MAAWYERHGYDVIARNWTMRGGELDVVAMRGNEIVVCEVKARATSAFGDPLEAMTPRKIQRVQRAGHAFLRDWMDLTGARHVRLRFDVASVLGTRLEMFENCF